MARSRKGRRKIQIVKMEKDSDLQVTYSKRRQGLFKKASELCTLCGVEIGILVFSPGRKVFSFGNPDVRYVFNRFKIYHQNPFQLTEFGPSATIRDLNSILSQVNIKFLLFSKNINKLFKCIYSKPYFIKNRSLYIYIYIYIYMCVCVCVCNLRYGMNNGELIIK